MQTALDLSRDAIAAYWSHQDPSGVAAKALSLMESREDWCADLSSNDVDEAVSSLAVRISQAEKASLEKVVIENPEVFIALMGVMRSSRAILLFRWMTNEHVNVAAFLLNLCSLTGEHGEADIKQSVLRKLMTERLMVLERMCLLGRIFSPTRLGMVLEVLEEVKNEND